MIATVPLLINSSFMQIIVSYLQNYYFLGAFLIVLFSFLVSYQLYPVIIYLSYIKNLSKVPEKRSSHVDKTPTIGGVGIFFGFTLTFAFVGAILSKYLLMNTLFDLGASIIILFFIGLEDDLLVISPFKKLVAQLLAAGIVIIFLGVRITSLDGIFGIYDLSYISSVLFTFFTFVLIINAYNLIDGIDGLAGTLALIICLFFGIYFLLNNQFTQVLVSFSLIGSLIAFLKFNTSCTRKIFMGDTGTMVVGFIIMYQAITFLKVNHSVEALFHFNNGPIFIIALLSFPLIDTLRVFIIRIKNKKNPFRPDRNHIHHCFLDSGSTHIEATIFISSIALAIILIAFFLQDLDINLGMFLIIMITILAYLPFTLKKNTIGNTFLIYTMKKQLQSDNKVTAKEINFKN